MDLVWFDITNGSYSRAFKQVVDFVSDNKDSFEVNPFDESLSQEFKKLLSLFYEFIAINYHLRCNFNSAKDNYIKAIQFDVKNFEASLKLSSVYLELGEVSNVINKILQFNLKLFIFILTNFITRLKNFSVH